MFVGLFFAIGRKFYMEFFYVIVVIELLKFVLWLFCLLYFFFFFFFYFHCKALNSGCHSFRPYLCIGSQL